MLRLKNPITIILLSILILIITVFNLAKFLNLIIFAFLDLNKFGFKTSNTLLLIILFFLIMLTYF